MKQSAEHKARAGGATASVTLRNPTCPAGSEFVTQCKSGADCAHDKDVYITCTCECHLAGCVAVQGAGWISPLWRERERERERERRERERCIGAMMDRIESDFEKSLVHWGEKLEQTCDLLVLVSVSSA